MRRNNFLVYDDFIAAHSPAIVTFSPTELNDKLGTFDQLAVMAVVDNLTNNTDGFNVWMAHSADARLWFYRLAVGDTPARPGTGNITWPSGGPPNGLDATKTNMLAYLDGGAAPLLAFVRFELQFSSTNTGGHVRLYVTQRDQGA